MKDNIVSTATYDPEFERTARAQMIPHARHQLVMEEQREEKARRRDNHKRGLHKLRFPAGDLR